MEQICDSTSTQQTVLGITTNNTHTLCYDNQDATSTILDEGDKAVGIALKFEILILVMVICFGYLAYCGFKIFYKKS